jgi:WD40 repeat protein
MGFVPSPDGGSRSRVITADLAPSGTLAAVVFRPEPPSAPDADADDEGDRIRYCSYVVRGEMLGDDIIPSMSSSSRVRAVRHASGHVLVAGDGKAALHYTTSGRAVKRCLEVDTGPNPLGVCALAEARDGKTVVLACPRQVQVGRRGSSGARVDVHAHSSSVVCVALSRDGRLLATASSKGTVVRIFTAADGKKVDEVR